MKYDYTYEDLIKALERLKFSKKHEVIFISGDVGRLGSCNIDNREEYFHLLITAAKIVFGNDVTLMTSTFTHDLVNKNLIYDKNKTLSMHGAIANFFVQHPNSIRSPHPYSSFCAIGPRAKYLCEEDIIHPYGIDSPYDKMLSLKKPLTISISLKPNITCSLVHHVEVICNVPYRYMKEFEQKMLLNGKKVEKNYCLPVLYKELDVSRNLNVKIFEKFKMSNIVKEQKVGRQKLYSYETNKLFKSMINQFKEDIYCWFNTPPKFRPYRR